MLFPITLLFVPITELNFPFTELSWARFGLSIENESAPNPEEPEDAEDWEDEYDWKDLDELEEFEELFVEYELEEDPFDNEDDDPLLDPEFEVSSEDFDDVWELDWEFVKLVDDWLEWFSADTWLDFDEVPPINPSNPYLNISAFPKRSLSSNFIVVELDPDDFEWLDECDVCEDYYLWFI